MEAVHEEMERDPSGTDGRQHEMGFVRGHSSMKSTKFWDFFIPPLVVVSFSTIIMFWTTSLPPPQCGRRISRALNVTPRIPFDYLCLQARKWMDVAKARIRHLQGTKQMGSYVLHQRMG